MDDGDVIRTALYVADSYGKVSLVLKSKMTVDLGAITGIGSQASWGLGLNSQGQVALTAQIDNGPDVILLLTPKSLSAPGG